MVSDCEYLQICNVKLSHVICCESRADWTDQPVLNDWHFELYGGVYAHTHIGIMLIWTNCYQIMHRAYNNFVALSMKNFELILCNMICSKVYMKQ